MLQTEFIHATLARPHPSEALDQVVESYLRQQGIPLRWAITAIHPQTFTLEAVILKRGGAN